MAKDYEQRREEHRQKLLAASEQCRLLRNKLQFENGSAIKPIVATKNVIRGNGWFIGLNDNKEE